MHEFTFNTCRSIINEPGAVKRIGAICQQQHIDRPLIVTDPGIAQLGLLSKLEHSLHAAGLAFSSFTQVVPEPPEASIYAALTQAKAETVDGVIGFGGGSSMDTAKLVALLAKSGENLQDIYGVDQVKGQRLPLVLIPTTAGTGSEVTAVAIVTTGESTKMAVVAPQLYADVAVLDAELTLALPATITAMTGIDSMVHAIEAYTSVHKKNPYSDMLARQALQLISHNLLTATQEPDNLSARQNMLLGAMMAGQAFANAPVAAVHALAYPLGGQFHIPHGLSNSLVLAEVMRFNSVVAAPLYAELATCITGERTPSGNTAKASNGLIDYIEHLIAELGLPGRLRDVDIPASALEKLAENAMLQQRLLVNNPREVSQSDALAIYQNVY